MVAVSRWYDGRDASRGSNDRAMTKLSGDNRNSPSKHGGPVLAWFKELMQTLFLTLLITYLLLMLLEAVFKGSVSAYLNVNYLLLIVIGIGVVAILTAPRKMERAAGERLTAKLIIMMVCAAIGAAAIIWYKTREIGWLSWVISATSGLIIMFLSLLVWQGDQGEEG